MEKNSLETTMRSSSSFSGNLGFIGLADIFQILGGNAATGCLHIASPHAEGPGVIYFIDGDPINASLGSLCGMDAIYALFGWKDGGFEFVQEAVLAGRVVKQSRMQIILDALRMLDDGLIPSVGAPSPAPEGGDERLESAFQAMKRPLLDYLYVIDEEIIQEGDPVVREGAHGKWIWVVLEGNVTITRQTAMGPMVVARVGEGGFIGGITSFLFSDSARSATVIAQGRARLGLLDSQRLHDEYSALSRELRALLLSAARRIKKTTDCAIKLYEKRPVSWDPSGLKPVLEKGAQGAEAFRVTQGAAIILGESRKGPVPLVDLEKSDVFGYTPFLHLGQETQAASVFGSRDLEWAPIDMASLQREFRGMSRILRTLVEHSCDAVLMTTRLAYSIHEGRADT